MDVPAFQPTPQKSLWTRFTECCPTRATAGETHPLNSEDQAPSEVELKRHSCARYTLFGAGTLVAGGVATLVGTGTTEIVFNVTNQTLSEVVGPIGYGVGAGLLLLSLPVCVAAAILRRGESAQHRGYEVIDNSCENGPLDQPQHSTTNQQENSQ